MNSKTWARLIGGWSLLVLMISCSAALSAFALALPAGQAAGATDQKPVATQEALPDPGSGVERLPAKPGDMCAVCSRPVGEKDPVFLFRGHRLPIHLHELQADLRRQLARLAGEREPHAALFQSDTQQKGPSVAWLLFGGYVLLGLVFAALCGHCALCKGYAGWRWFAAGLLLNIFAFVALLALPSRGVAAPEGVPKGLTKIPATRRPLLCPGCGELNHPSARNCAGCSASLKPECDSEVDRAHLGGARA